MPEIRPQNQEVITTSKRRKAIMVQASRSLRAQVADVIGREESLSEFVRTALVNEVRRRREEMRRFIEIDVSAAPELAALPPADLYYLIASAIVSARGNGGGTPDVAADPGDAGFTGLCMGLLPATEVDHEAA